MTARAYNIVYLEDAMSTVGAMFDYAVNACGEDLSLFYARFIGSGIARSLSSSNPKYIAGMSGIELALEVSCRTGDELPLINASIDMGSPEYWTGWTLAYLSWYLCMDFGTLQLRGVTAESVHERYSVLHEADLSKSVQFAVRRIAETTAAANPLKQARNNAGLTQSELASLSGVPIRVIRSYEQGQRSLGNANADNIKKMCMVLGCRADDILS